MGEPTLSFSEIFHVGTLNPKAKGRESLEGAGLSVSEHPEAWTRIARLGGLPWWRLTKPGNRFLDALALTDARREGIEAWAVKHGYLKPVEAYRVEFFDEEGEPRYMMFEDRDRAEFEAESYETDVEPANVLAPTEKLERRVGVSTDLISAFDHVLTVYAEDVMGVDGVWWMEELDVPSLSAPRGVIVPSMVGSWQAKRVKRINARKNPDARLDWHRVSDESVYLDWLEVPRSYERRGLGARTYKEWEAKLPPEVQHVYIHAGNVGRGPSRPFWERMGFYVVEDEDDLSPDLSDEYVLAMIEDVSEGQYAMRKDLE